MSLLLRAENVGSALVLLLLASAASTACSPATGGTGTGGQSSVGGAVGITGGTSSNGGASVNGGSVASGGTNATGGIGSVTGGSTSSGGSSAGGAAVNGGTSAGGAPAGGSAAGGVAAGGTTAGSANGGASKGGTGMGGGAVGGQSGAVGSGGAGAGGKSASGGSAGSSGGAATGGTGGGSACALPSTFKWTTGAPVMLPKSDATHDLVAIKDPTVVRYDNRFHLFASSVTKAGAYNMVYANFSDWSQAAAAPLYYMDQTPNFNTYTAAPQVFYFTPQKKWYLIFQSGPPMYSTNDDITAPSKWTKPAPFYASEPPIITQNDGWLDYWIICDSENCHLFFSDDHGRWYKAKTPVANFPNGFSQPIIAMQDAEAGKLFEGSSVYKVSGSNKYLALIEAFDQTSNWKRYFRSWTSESLEGPWQALADSGTNPFVGKANVTFTGTVWTDNISHGDMVRSGYDEAQLVDPCNFQFVYQGFDPAADGAPYNSLPWKLGLLTRTP